MNIWSEELKNLSICVKKKGNFPAGDAKRTITECRDTQQKTEYVRISMADGSEIEITNRYYDED
jgi:hypothetical protein